MAFDLRQELRLSQQLVMTPQLQLAIKLLQMCKLELADKIQQEMTENPFLEEAQEAEKETSEEGEGSTIERVDSELEMFTNAKEGTRLEWKDYIAQSSNESYIPFDESEERGSFEAVVTKSTSLADHLMWQLHMSGFTGEEQEIGELIIGNLNQDGYLQPSLAEIAKVYLFGEGREEGEATVPTLPI